MEYYRHSQLPAADSLVRDFCLLLLRIVAAAGLLYWHAWQSAREGWEFLWRKTAWPLLETMKLHGFPVPEAATIVLVAAVLLCCAFLLAGVLARVGAGVLLGMVIVAAPLYPAYPDLLEKFGLYGAIFAVLVLDGPGRFSVDALLTRRRVRRRP